MFPFSIKNTIAVTTLIEKEQFSLELMERLVAKLKEPDVKTEESAFLIRFDKGFAKALVNFNWIGGGFIRIDYSSDKILIVYEVFFIAALAIFCFLNLFYLVIFFQGELQWEILLSVTSAIWLLYLLLLWFTSLVFSLRIRKSLKEIELSKAEISAEQLSWINSVDQCPACGYTINRDIMVCPECGLQLK